MADWWQVWSSYRPSDLLMFSPRTYWRLVELANRQAWPLQLLVPALGVVLAWALLRGRRRAPHALLVLLAVAWAAAAWGWHLERYAAINWAAKWFAAGFVLQALLWLVAAALPLAAPTPLARQAAVVLLLASLLYPLVGLAGGRPLMQAESLALTADPTVLAGLGGVLLARQVWLWPLPLLWCGIGGLTLWTLGEPLQALLLPAAALIAIALARARR